MTITAKRQREMQASGVQFGCWVNYDLDEDWSVPNTCVKDDGDLLGCDYAEHYKTREGCPYWREIVEIKGETK